MVSKGVSFFNGVTPGSLNVGGIGDRYNPPIGRKNATYIPLIVLAPILQKMILRKTSKVFFFTGKLLLILEKGAFLKYNISITWPPLA